MIYLVEDDSGIQDRVWGMEDLGETRTLWQTLGIGGDAIETVRGIGYRFNGNH